MARTNNGAALRVATDRRAAQDAQGGAEAVASAAALAWAGQHEQAIAVATAALAAAPDDRSACRFDLLGLRADSFIATGELARAAEDAATMRAIADRSDSSALQARALNCQSRVHSRGGDQQAAIDSATAALRAARRCRRKSPAAHSLVRLAEAQMRAHAYESALENATAGELAFESLGDALHRGRAFWVAACAHDGLDHAIDSDKAAEKALALARQCGDRYGEACALNIRYRQHPDPATQLRGLHQALAAFRAAGDRSGQAAVYNNLSLSYGTLGLHRHARRMMLLSLGFRRKAHDTWARVNGSGILSLLELRMGHTREARRRLDESTLLNAPQPDRDRKSVV